MVGDFLFSRAFQLMVSDGSLKVLKILSDASAIIAEGEVLQLLTNNDTETSEEAYLEVIRSKTAKLFAAAARGSCEQFRGLRANHFEIRLFAGLCIVVGQ